MDLAHRLRLLQHLKPSRRTDSVRLVHPLVAGTSALASTALGFAIGNRLGRELTKSKRPQKAQTPHANQDELPTLWEPKRRLRSPAGPEGPSAAQARRAAMWRKLGNPSTRMPVAKNLGTRAALVGGVVGLGGTLLAKALQHRRARTSGNQDAPEGIGSLLKRLGVEREGKGWRARGKHPGLRSTKQFQIGVPGSPNVRYRHRGPRRRGPNLPGVGPQFSGPPAIPPTPRGFPRLRFGRFAKAGAVGLGLGAAGLLTAAAVRRARRNRRDQDAGQLLPGYVAGRRRGTTGDATLREPSDPARWSTGEAAGILTGAAAGAGLNALALRPRIRAAHGRARSRVLHNLRRGTPRHGNPLALQSAAAHGPPRRPLTHQGRARRLARSARGKTRANVMRRRMFTTAALRGGVGGATAGLALATYLLAKRGQGRGKRSDEPVALAGGIGPSPAGLPHDPERSNDDNVGHKVANAFGAAGLGILFADLIRKRRQRAAEAPPGRTVVELDRRTLRALREQQKRATPLPGSVEAREIAQSMRGL